MTSVVVSVDGLRKAYRNVVAVDDVSFEVEEGEIFGLLGPNGAGKTTTVECLQALRQPDSGRMSVLGLDPTTAAGRLRRIIGSQLQESALPDRIRVWEALDLFASFHPASADWRELMERWDLSVIADIPFAKLSGGQRQRLLVALALVNRPKVVFLDEMTTGLDPAARRVAWELVREIRGDGATVVLVTHFMDEADNLCDRIAVIDAGRVVAMDTPQGVKRLAGSSRVVFTTDADTGWLTTVPGVERVDRFGPRVEVSGQGPLVVRVAAALSQHGLEPADLRLEQPTLEEAFLRLTGRALED